MRRAAQRATSLLTLCALLASAGCGSGGTTARSAAGLRVEREDLVAVARALAAVEQDVGVEVTATRAAWRSVANGLPADAGSVPQPRIRAAAQQANAIRIPGLLERSRASGLTGPASGIAGLFRGFAGLAGRGWHMIGGALDEIERGPSATARFARANVALYIESVYDAHFGLAQIGKRLLSAYVALGGPTAFGTSLTQAEVDRLAAAYSEAAARLHPHPRVRLGS